MTTDGHDASHSRSATSRRIWLTGGWFSSDNIGDHAMLSGLLDAIGGRLPGATVSVITAQPDRVTHRYGIPALAPKKTPLALLRGVAGADALIFTGGTPFYDAAAHMTYFATLATLAAACRVPVIIFGISLRSIRRGYSRTMLRRILGAARIIGGREQRSLRALGGIVGVDDERLLFVPDAATQMVPSSAERGRGLLRDAGVDPDTPRVALCMRDFRSERSFQIHHYSRSYDEPALRRYHETCRLLIERVVRRHDHDVLLCPMHTNPPDDDRRIMAEVLDSIADPGIARRVTLLAGQHQPRDMKAILGEMQLCIGVRFHSLVLSTGMNVPALALAYASKNNAIMHQMGLDRYTLELARLRSAEAVDRLDELFERRSALVELLERRNVELAAVYARGLDRLEGALNGR